jgi:predicted nucleotidyltransferase
MTDLDLLARQVGANERTLRRAFNDGAIRGERPTPRKLKIAAPEMGYLRRSWGLLAALRSTLRTEQNVRFALLFGSAARGDDGASSDVDLLVEMRDSSLARIADLGAKLEAMLGRRVDILTLDEAKENMRLLVQAVDEGRVLVDREGRWLPLRDEATGLRSRAEEGARREKQRALAGIDRMLADEVE